MICLCLLPFLSCTAARRFACRSLGLLLVILTKSCAALPNCKAEKAINHMLKIKNVESYVYNDTHLLNINNKGIKVLT